MLDNAIRAGAMRDWITPLLSLIHKIVFRAVGYNVPETCGYSLYQIRDLLKAHGIKARYLAIVGPVGAGTMTFNVSRRDDWRAQGIMSAYGIPYAGGRTYRRQPFLPGAQGQGQPTAPTAAPSVPVVGKEYNADAAAQLAARRNRREG